MNIAHARNNVQTARNCVDDADHARSVVMRVTIGQINTTNGDFESNTASVIRGIEHAKKEESDLVVFPETCIQGYTSFDWFLDRDVQRCALDPLQKIVEATKGITAVVGTVRPSGLLTGRRLYNAAAVIRNQELLGFADKTLLPDTTSSTIHATSNPASNDISFPERKETRRRSVRRFLERQNFLARTTLHTRSGR